MSRKDRIDVLLIERGLASDEAHARALLMAGKVRLTDASGRTWRVDKPGDRVDPEVSIEVEEPRRFVSRGGEKLSAALDAFRLDVRGWVCADIGIGTGGFTDCLLKRGALRVHGVDVGYGAVDLRLRNDPRVILHERTNARLLAEGALGERVRLAAIDVSFISLALVLGPVASELTEDGEIVALIKPQFEAERGEAPGGVVRDPGARRRAVERVLGAARDLGLVPRAEIESPIAGRRGNVEVLVHLAREADRTP